MIVVARSDPGSKSPAKGISLFLVESGTPGFKKGRKLKKLGFKAQDTSELFFDDVRVPADALLGKENGGFVHLMTELPQERLLIANIAQSGAEWAFEEARAYVKQRKAFGRSLADLQVGRVVESY